MIMFNKKNLTWAGLFVASFLIINVGVYFVLKATQPKIGKRMEAVATKGAATDSTKTVAAKADSTRAMEAAATQVSAPVVDSTKPLEVQPVTADIADMPIMPDTT